MTFTDYFYRDSLPSPFRLDLELDRLRLRRDRETGKPPTTLYGLPLRVSDAAGSEAGPPPPPSEPLPRRSRSGIRANRHFDRREERMTADATNRWLSMPTAAGHYWFCTDYDRRHGAVIERVYANAAGFYRHANWWGEGPPIAEMEGYWLLIDDRRDSAAPPTE